MLTPERWQQIKQLVNSAIAADADTRSAILQQSCADDLPLRLGAEALLSFHEDATRRLANAPVVALNLQVPLSPDRWQQVEQLFQAALEREPAERVAFLAKACGVDVALRHEVELLLVYQAAAGELIGGAIQQAAGLLANGSGDKARFTPGMTLNKRYRIIGMLGRGGMGEVYRADDLKLGHPVGLKFLTEKLSQDKAMLTRFHSEVAMAHCVTHPNVCRVHDIGEVATSSGKLHFLSMEYVDGEDLSSLLRRIGRLPADKAVEIATQLCAGISAAHEAGVLHRDLKPANVMLDGKGRVRITDFGLAGFAEQIKGQEVMAGTPAYMSPEQFAGKEVTTKSDIYALGLVLYEIFTGKRVFEASSLAELQKMHESSSPTNPSNWVKDIDPLVERVILRCLEKDPGKRLASAKQVANALPGGDPLAAALALGETPSPEMVAAAGSENGLPPAIAVICLAAVAIGLFLAAWANGKLRVIHRLPFDNPPEVLTRKAREISTQLGYLGRSADSVWDFTYNTDYLSYLTKNDPLPRRWDYLQPQAIFFRYRESPQHLLASSDGIIQYFSAATYLPPSLPGMVDLGLSSQGRLLWFCAVPIAIEGTVEAEPNWAAILQIAGLEPAKFIKAEPQRTPPVACDTRIAWTGTFTEQPNATVRVEAAAWRGKPVYFEVIYPWTQQSQIKLLERNPYNSGIGSLLFFIVLFISALIARSNYLRGRGDYRGAFKLACLLFCCYFAAAILWNKYTPSTQGVASLVEKALALSFFWGNVAWLLYFAFEPYVRRRWPIVLISWSRIMTGRLRDALVGRDLLIGILGGITVYLLGSLQSYIAGTRPETWPGSWNSLYSLSSLLGMRMTSGIFASICGDSVILAIEWLFYLFLLQVLLRRQWLAVVASILLVVFMDNPANAMSIASFLIAIAFSAVLVCLGIRFGLVTIMSSLFTDAMLHGFPVILTFSWYASSGIFAITIILALAIYGFYTSLGGQKVFTGKLLEE